MPIARGGLWVLTLAALALLVRTWWLGSVPGVWLFVAWMVLLVWVVGGLAFPRWEMFADLVWRAPAGDSSSVLTFDGLPEPPQLEEWLALLERYAAPATFFVNGASLDASSVGAIARAGHRLALSVAVGSERGVAALARRFSEGTAAIVRATGDREAVLPALRPNRRLLTPALAEAARRAQLELVGGSLGWPPSRWLDREHWVSRLGPGQLVCIPVALVGLQPEHLARLLQAAAERRIRWVPLAEWLR